MRNRWLRLVRHWWLDESDARRALGDDGLQRIGARVAESERRHGGEIRVCIEGGLPWSYLWRNAGARERAVAMFSQLRVWDTEANNGVLIYLLLADHAIEIVADRGLARHVTGAEWAAITAGMREAFRAGRFVDGLLDAIGEVDRMLVAHFPHARGAPNPNELPDLPHIG